MFNKSDNKLRGLKSVLHIDLMFNAGPYWARKTASISESYTFADSSNINSVVSGLKIQPTHIVLGGGFWNSEIAKNPRVLIEYLEQNRKCVTWSYWGDGTKSLMKDPFPNTNEKLIDAIFCSSSDAVKSFQDAGYFSTYAVHPVETEIFYRDETIQKEYDWTFVGTNYGSTRQKILDTLRNLDYSYKIFGPGHNPKVPNLTFEQTASLMRQSKISININDDLYTDLIRYFSDRIPMAMCCDSMVLTTYQPGIETIFKKGSNIDWFKTEDELVELLNKYLKNDSIRKTISYNGYKKAIEEYSVKNLIPYFFNTSIKVKNANLIKEKNKLLLKNNNYTRDIAKKYNENDYKVSDEYIVHLTYAKETDIVLDLGCGTGRYIPHVNAQRIDVVDLSKEMLSFASKKKTKNNVIPQIYPYSIQEFIKGKYDVYDFIYSIGVFGYPQLNTIYKDINIDLINDIHRSLKKNGLFFASFCTLGCDEDFVRKIMNEIFSEAMIWNQSMKEVYGYKPPDNIFFWGKK